MPSMKAQRHEFWGMGGGAYVAPYCRQCTKMPCTKYGDPQAAELCEQMDSDSEQAREERELARGNA